MTPFRIQQPTSTRWVALLFLVLLTLTAHTAEREHTEAEVALLDQARQELAEDPAAALVTLGTWDTAPSVYHQLLLAKARELTDDAAGAEAAYRAALALAPAMPEARRGLLAFLHGRGLHGKICALAGELLRPEEAPHQELVIFADAAYRSGDRALCDLLAGIGLRRFPTEPAYRRLLLLRAMDDGDDHRATAYLRDALAAEPEAPELWLHLAAVRARLEDGNGERAALRAAALLDPADRAVRLRLVQALHAAGMHPEAHEHAAAVMAGETKPDRNGVLLCALAAHAAGKDADATAWLEGLDDDDPQVLGLRVRILLDAGERTAVEELLAAAIADGLADADLLLLAAVNALHLGRGEAAEDRFRQVLAALEPDDRRVVPATLGLAQLLLRRDATAEAAALLRPAVAAFPQEAGLAIMLEQAEQ